MTVSREERDANLDALLDAASAYFDQEIARIDKETRFLEEILRIRGASSAGVATLGGLQTELERDLRAFLET